VCHRVGLGVSVRDQLLYQAKFGVVRRRSSTPNEDHVGVEWRRLTIVINRNSVTCSKIKVFRLRKFLNLTSLVFGDDDRGGRSDPPAWTLQ